jgi:hypothetical protein
MTMALSASAAGQHQPLQTYFEGKPVTLLMDMPGTSEGVNVGVGRATDFKEYGNRIKRFGVALRAGERVVVTFVKVKKDLIEFQLAGGGYGTVGDDTNTSANIPFVEKSERETSLELQIRDEKDSHKRRALERDLQEMQRYRERENRRITAEREMIADYKRQMLAVRRQQGGSRLNLRYERAVPAGVTPDDVMTALGEFVDFSEMNAPVDGPVRDGGGPAIVQPRRGMLRLDAERAFGEPTEETGRAEGSLIVVTATFLRGNDKITAEFVEDVMIRFAMGKS